MNIRSKVRLALCCSAALCAFAVEPSATLFENAEVKVVRGLEKAHVKGSFHEHKTNRVMVYLQDGRQRFEYQDGRAPAVFDWKAGQVAWSPPEGMHSPEVVSDDPFNIIEIELKKPGAGAVAAARVDGKYYKIELENEQVRALRLTLGAHESTPMMGHSRNIVAVFLTDQETRATDSNGKVDIAKHKAGDVVWETPRTRKLENTGDKPLEMVLVEVGI